MTYERLMDSAGQIRDWAVRASLAQLEDPERYQAAIEREFADVPEAFVAIAAFPDPGELDGPVQALTELSTEDVGEAALIGSTAAALSFWTGEAAQRFRDGFLAPGVVLARNRAVVCAVLVGALVAERDLWARARADAEMIVAQTLGALAACGDCTRTEWTVVFTVVASVAAVAAVPLSGGAALLVGGVGAVAQVVAVGGPAEEAPRSSFTADSPAEVVQRMREAIWRLQGFVGQRRVQIGLAVSGARRLMEERAEWFGWQ